MRSVSNNCQERDPSSKPLWLGMRSGPLWLGIFHSIFPSQLLNSKKRQESPKTSNFPQVDCSTLTLNPSSAFSPKNRTTPLPSGQPANRPVPPCPLSTKDIKPFLFDGWIPFTKTSLRLWPLSFRLEMFLLLLNCFQKWFICKNWFTRGLWIFSAVFPV